MTFRLREIEDGGIATVRAGNVSDVTGWGFELAIGTGGVKVI